MVKHFIFTVVGNKRHYYCISPILTSKSASVSPPSGATLPTLFFLSSLLFLYSFLPYLILLLFLLPSTLLCSLVPASCWHMMRKWDNETSVFYSYEGKWHSLFEGDVSTAIQILHACSFWCSNFLCILAQILKKGML